GAGPRVGSGLRNRLAGCWLGADRLRKIFFEEAQTRQLPVKPRSRIKLLLPALAFVLALRAESALACAVCYGDPGAPMSKGLVWGIFSLMAVVIPVLGGIGGFFIYLASRSASISPTPAAE